MDAIILLILCLVGYSRAYWFFVKFGATSPEFEKTTFRLNSSNPALPYISLFLIFQSVYMALYNSITPRVFNGVFLLLPLCNQ